MHMWLFYVPTGVRTKSAGAALHESSRENQGELRQHKVATYITQGDRLLVFRHRDQPELGIQVPGGSIAPGEDPACAALREAHEETALTALTLIAYLGRRIHALTSLQGLHVLQDRHYYHLRCDEPTPERWLAWETDPSDGSPGPIAFALYWAPLHAVPPLAGELGALLAKIGGREVQSPHVAPSAP
jgi:8-oxo-dGTP diphosphatase